MRSAILHATARPYRIQLFSVLAAGFLIVGPPGDRGRGDSPERRALGYLACEVPRWSVENKCFSCHNNGDAARALFAAKRLGFPISNDSIKGTAEWLTAPEKWDHNGGEGPFSDKRLARIQFAAALQSAVESGMTTNRDALVRAAERVADDQEPAGSWLSDLDRSLGSPATYGRPLATYLARETLRAADAKRFSANIEKANHWLSSIEVQNVMDAAVILLASGNSPDSTWRKQRKHALSLVRQGQSEDGGWGPFVTAPPEPFDTALVLLALRQNIDSFPGDALIQRGRAFLIAHQLPDGSWTETTRPAGAESYAQRISTTGWATLALLHSSRR